jgi:DNA-binding NarL/FixJ family response regulator
VGAALHSRGFDTITIRWPVVERTAHGAVPRVVRGGGRGGSRNAPVRPDVAVLLSELSTLEQVCCAQLLLGTLDAPSVVLAGVSRGPVWGALYESGANLVMPTQTSLDELCAVLDDAHHGRTPLAAAPRPELVRSWRSFAHQHRELTDRIRTLTNREEEVLQQLHQGLGVRSIAERGEVTEATVRSQVKAILRKLEVSSQIAAVAVYEKWRRDAT